MSTETIYVVLSAYYKHGEADIEIIRGDDNLDIYLRDELPKYHYIDEEELDEIEDILALIDFAIEKGNKQIDEQWGWGILNIVKIVADNIKTIDYMN